MKTGTSSRTMGGLDPAAAAHRDDWPASRRRWPGRQRLAAALGSLAIAAAAGAYFAYQEYREARLADSVRRLFAARRYDEARGPLQRWLDVRPRSAIPYRLRLYAFFFLRLWVDDRPRPGEAQYYRAWLALVEQRPADAVDAIVQAQKLGFDRAVLDVLVGIYQARAGLINEAEPILRAAFERRSEPQAEVARELVRIYLPTYRLAQAAEVVERYRELVPTDPEPYIWSNEIGSRSGASPAILIRNYRAALERAPDLDKARLGLAEQLSKDRRFDEAAQEYRTYLRRNPKDVSAIVGLGRNAFQDGDIEGATREFEAALAIDPRQRDALKELAQLDMRFGRFEQGRRRLEILTQIDPYDHEVRYTYSQALRLVGDLARSRVEGERAAQLRKEQDEIVKLRFSILKDPNDLASRFEVARWMFEHGHADEGLKWAKEILRADPRHAGIHRALADYYAKHGDPGRANYHRTMALSSQDAR